MTITELNRPTLHRLRTELDAQLSNIGLFSSVIFIVTSPLLLNVIRLI